MNKLLILLIISTSVLALFGFDLPAAYGDPVNTEAAYWLLNQRVTANQTNFFVYQDADSGFNHGFPSGFFGAINKIDLDTACVDDSTVGNGCSINPNALDRNHRNVFRISFNPLLYQEFAGVNFEEPEHFGVPPTGRGYDLRGATQVSL